MHRRELLRLLGGASAFAALPVEDLFALGERTHAALRSDPSAYGFFDAHQMQTVSAACDRILPGTETPGARDADCHHFIERIVADHYDADRQKRFVTGLVDLDQRSSRATQKLFVDLVPTEQDEYIALVERDARASEKPAATFWRDLKYLTLYGFYTSRIGIQEELEVEFYPGRFDGCVTIGGA